MTARTADAAVVGAAGLLLRYLLVPALIRHCLDRGNGSRRIEVGGRPGWLTVVCAEWESCDMATIHHDGQPAQAKA